MKLCRIAHLMLGLALLSAQYAQATPRVVDTNSKRYDAARAEALSAQNNDQSIRAGMKADLLTEDSQVAPVETNSKRFDKARSEALSKSKKIEEGRAQLNLNSELTDGGSTSQSNVVDTNPKRFDAARAKSQSK